MSGRFGVMTNAKGRMVQMTISRLAYIVISSSDPVVSLLLVERGGEALRKRSIEAGIRG